MERVVKFRGKTLSGKWVYGDLVHFTNTQGVDASVIITEHQATAESDDFDYALCYARNEFKIVLPESVGQFTGLHDKNGKEVYEGDVLVICEYKNMLTGVVCEEGEHELFTLDELKGELQQQYKSVIHYEDCTLFASEQDGCDIYLASLAGDMRKSYPIFEYEVIGNIHDNPNLLNDGRD